jgi:hypothetical protein
METVSFNSGTYAIPSVSTDTSWGTQLTTYLAALASGAAGNLVTNSFASEQVFEEGAAFGQQGTPASSPSYAQVYASSTDSNLYALLAGATVPQKLTGEATQSSGAANLVVATPNGSSGYPTQRALVVADLPPLSPAILTQDGATPGQVLGWNGTVYAPQNAGGGSVTYVGLSMPSDFSVTPSDVTGSATFDVTWSAQAANLVHAGPASGSAAVPTWRNLVLADIPLLPFSQITGTIATGQVSGSYAGITGVGTLTAGVWNATPLTASYVPALSALSGALNLSQLAQSGATTGQAPTWNGTAWVPGTPTGGTVTSVALTAPGALFTTPVSGSPITGAGTLALVLASQSANQAFLSPNGSAGTPGFRSLVAADIPTTLNATTFNGTVTVSNNTVAFTQNGPGYVTLPGTTNPFEFNNTAGTGQVPLLFLTWQVGLIGGPAMFSGNVPSNGFGFDGSSNPEVFVGSAAVAKFTSSLTTFNTNVSLTGTGNSVGTITSGTWNGTALTASYVPALSALSGSLNLAQLAQNSATTGQAAVWNGSAWAPGTPSGATGGTVTSIGMTVPSFLSVSPGTITTAGTFAISLSGTALPTTNGGTGFTTFTSEGVVYASSTSALAQVPVNSTATNKYLQQVSSGAPTFAQIAFSDLSGTAANGQLSGSYTGITGIGTLTAGTWNATTIGPTYGGTGLTTYTLGDTLYASAANTLARLAGNTTTTRQFHAQTGTGTVSAAPIWTALAASDIPSTLNATTFNTSATAPEFLVTTGYGWAYDSTATALYGLINSNEAVSFAPYVADSQTNTAMLLGVKGSSTATYLNNGYNTSPGLLVTAAPAGGTFAYASVYALSYFAEGGGFVVFNALANTSSFVFSSGATGDAYTGMRYNSAGLLAIIGNESSGGPNSAPPGATIYAANIVTKTANYTCVQLNTGARLNNLGATGAVTFTLPTPFIGATYTFTNLVAQTLNVTTPSGSIFFPGLTGATRTTTVQYSSCTITCFDGTNWVAESIVGTWS